MGVTFTLGSAVFEELRATAGRKAISCRVGAAQYSIHRFHPQGTDGNLVIFGGRTGAPIVAHCRYQGTLATALANFKTDRDGWVGTAISITDENGDTYERCTLVEAVRITDAVAIGRNSLVFFDVMATFTWDG